MISMQGQYPYGRYADGLCVDGLYPKHSTPRGIMASSKLSTDTRSTASSCRPQKMASIPTTTDQYDYQYGAEKHHDSHLDEQDGAVLDAADLYPTQPGQYAPAAAQDPVAAPGYAHDDDEFDVILEEEVEATPPDNLSCRPAAVTASAVTTFV